MAEVDPQPDPVGEVGRVAIELAATAEGRAAGLSVETWPLQAVHLSVRSGKELRVFIARHDVGGGTVALEVRWERVEPGLGGGRPRTSEGGLGAPGHMRSSDLRDFLTRWLVFDLVRPSPAPTTEKSRDWSQWSQRALREAMARARQTVEAIWKAASATDPRRRASR